MKKDGASKKKATGYLFMVAGFMFCLSGFIGEQPANYGVGVMFFIIGISTIQQSKKP